MVISAAVLALPACGDDGDSGRLTRAEFLQEANAICGAGEAELDRAGETVFADLGESAEPDAAEISQFLNEFVIPNVEEQFDDIDALEPPEDLEDDIEELLEMGRAALADLRELAEEDPEAVFDGEDPFDDVNVAAETLGLTTCTGDEEGGDQEGDMSE